MLQPGSTIGILGGGQLGRMLAVAASRLGYRCHIYAPEAESVAAEVSAGFTCADWHDAAALKTFADACDVITYEFENVPVAPLAALDQAKLAPGTQALEVAQDRLSEKSFVEELGGKTASHAAVANAGELAEAIARIGAPGILKTRRDGYDGKGQWRIDSPGAATSLDIAYPEHGCVYEGKVTFAAEFSVILVRNTEGEVMFWDSPLNTHEHGILAHSELPAPEIVTAQTSKARVLARKVADALDYVGVLTLEFFATKQGPVFNEMAPRVHNSGHWTIEGALTSQFGNHIRAICGLPLGDTETVGERVVMDNLIGADALDLAAHLRDPAAFVHLYGKAEAREGRKMGHITRITHGE